MSHAIHPCFQNAALGSTWQARAEYPQLYPLLIPSKLEHDQDTIIINLNFGDEPLGRVYIDTLSSVSCSFWTSDIDAHPLAALWSGKRGGVKRLRSARRRLAPRW